METTETKGPRVRRNTPIKENVRIDEKTKTNIEYFASIGSAAIDGRIEELEREWDIERTLELNAAVFAFSGTVLGALVHRRWLLLPAFVTAFLAQHAIQGWCPPVPLFRKLGIRTREEIDAEKYALKGLRGDFNDIDNADEAWAAVH